MVIRESRLVKESENLKEFGGKVVGSFTLASDGFNESVVSIVKNSTTNRISVTVKSYDSMGGSYTYYRGSSLKGLFNSLYKVKTDEYGKKTSIIKTDDSDYYLFKDESQLPKNWKESLNKLYKEVENYKFKSSNKTSSDYRSTEDLLKDIVPRNFDGNLMKQGKEVTYEIQGLDEDLTDDLSNKIENTLRSKGFSFDDSVDYSSVWSRGKYIVDIWSEPGEFTITVSEESDE